MGHVAWVLEHSDTEKSQRLVLIALALYASEEEHIAYPSVGTLSKLTRLSERGVQYALRRLVDDAEVVELESLSKYGTKRYRLPVERGEVTDALTKIAPEVIYESSLNESSFHESSSNESSLSLFGFNSEKHLSGAKRTDSDISEVWTFYQQTIPNGVRYKLNAHRRQCIKRALRERTLDECKRAIIGLSRSAWHLENGFVGIDYALGTDERIDRLAANISHIPGSSSVPSDDPAKLTPDQEDRLDEDVHSVQWMFEHPVGVNVTDGEQALIRLQRYGLEIELDESRTRVVRISTATVEDPRLARLQPLIEQRVRHRFGF